MLIAIAILLGLNVIFELFQRGDFSVFGYAALIIVLWHILFPLAVILISIIVIILIILMITNW